MDVRLLVVPQCPHENAAAQLLRTGLDDVGLAQVMATTVVISDEQQAAREGFPGSPTITIDGVDPFAEPGRPTALACRMYRTSAGLSGTPDHSALHDAVKRAANRT